MNALDFLLLGCGVWVLIVIGCYWWLINDVTRDPLPTHKG